MTDQTAERFAVNLRRARERAGLSQKDVAEAMTELGYPMPQQTIGRIENGQRAVRGPGELLALTRAVRAVSLDALLRPAGLQEAAWRLLDTARRVRETRDAVKEHDTAVRYLRRQIERAEADGNAADLADEIAVARRTLAGEGE